MKRTILLLAAVAPLVVYAQAAKDGAKKSNPTDSAKEKKQGPGGEVNWSGQIIKATGSGAPDMKATSPAQARLGAETSAKLDAFRNLIGQVKGINISSGKTGADSMTSDDVRARVEGVIRGYKVTAKRYYSDNGVEIDVEVPLSALTEALIPTTTGADEKKLACNFAGEKRNTGLIVDASGLGVTPALAPRILDEAGNTLYASDCVKEPAKKDSGIASYVDNLDAAKKNMKIGDKPLVLKAKSVSGSDLVISAEDVKKLGEGNNSYLAEGRVVIVTK